MVEDEFSFIQRFFGNINPEFEDQARAMGLELGVGDDAALLNLQGSYAVTTDTLIENVHFFPNFNAQRLGARALDVNFSDLYAMGAQPQFVTLSLNIPDRYMDFDEYWSAFSESFGECLLNHNCALIGGNICHINTRGAPLTISVTAIGKSMIDGLSFRRNAAQVGDVIVCTGTLACNGLYVKATYNNVVRGFDLESRRIFEYEAFGYDHRISTMVKLLLPYCKCAIDVSDGLLGDLSHILVQSQCAAKINYEALPINEFAREHCADCYVSEKSLLRMALAAGGDYNLLFTMSEENYEEFMTQVKACPELYGFPITKIGKVVEPTYDQMVDIQSSFLGTCPGLITLVNNEGKVAKLKLGTGSFNHFLNSSSE